jgi:hypothetical protein
VTIGHDEIGGHVEPTKVDVLPGDIEVLIEEARRRARHRRIAMLVVTIVVVSLLTSVVAAVRDPATLRAVSSGSSEPGAPGLATGPNVSLELAGPLAVSPNGVLYVFDVARHQVLERLSDGQFRVVAGDGRNGFAGDGGPAERAELSNVTDLAFSALGDLIVADGGRVREVDQHGVIRTIAGTGNSRGAVANGTPALSAGLGSSLYVTVSQSNQLYISTGSQLLRMTATGTLATVRADVASGPLKGPLDRNLGPIAVDNRGNLYVSGFNGWSIWRVRPNGAATYVGYQRQNGGNYAALVQGNGGTVFDEDGSTINQVQGSRLSAWYSFTAPVRGQYFWLTNFAVGPHGVIYADDVWGGVGFEAHQQLVAVRSGQVRLLWQESRSEKVKCVDSCS